MSFKELTEIKPAPLDQKLATIPTACQPCITYRSVISVRIQNAHEFDVLCRVKEEEMRIRIPTVAYRSFFARPGPDTASKRSFFPT